MYFPVNGAYDPEETLAIVGDWSQLVYSIRQDMTFKIFDSGVVQDPSTGNILYNLMQNDMVALRAVMRLGWEIPNPINAYNVDNTKAFSFRFSEKEFNGIGTEFTLDIYSGDTLLWSDTKTGNKSTLTVLDGFTVQNPTKIRVTIKKWSLGGRRVRIPRLMVGLYEIWDRSILKSVETYSEVTFSGLSIPYSTCTVVLYNENHRFDPYG